MYLVWIGVVLIALKAIELGPMAELSWWWVLSPLAVALVWFEWVEKWFGRDRRNVEHIEWERKRKERVAAQFPVAEPPRRR